MAISPSEGTKCVLFSGCEVLPLDDHTSSSAGANETDKLPFNSLILSSEN